MLFLYLFIHSSSILKDQSFQKINKNKQQNFYLH